MTMEHTHEHQCPQPSFDVLDRFPKLIPLPYGGLEMGALVTLSEDWILMTHLGSCVILSDSLQGNETIITLLEEFGSGW